MHRNIKFGLLATVVMAFSAAPAFADCQSCNASFTTYTDSACLPSFGTGISQLGHVTFFSGSSCYTMPQVVSQIVALCRQSWPAANCVVSANFGTGGYCPGGTFAPTFTCGINPALGGAPRPKSNR